MDNVPIVTIVIPCFNHGGYLAETLDSVQAQTYPHYEVIVVNDGSTDAATVELLRNLGGPKIRVIHTDNHGVSAARNRGIYEARGTYILPLDADDKIAPTYLEKAVALLDTRPEVVVVYCEWEMFGEREGVVMRPEYDPRALLIDNLLYAAAIYRKTDWEKVGGYSEKMVYGWEDWDFWISLSELKKNVIKLPEVLFYYRITGTSRDHSLTFFQKLAMLGTIIWRHKRLYLRNIFYVAIRLSVSLVFRLHYNIRRLRHCT